MRDECLQGDAGSDVVLGGSAGAAIADRAYNEAVAGRCRVREKELRRRTPRPVPPVIMNRRCAAEALGVVALDAFRQLRNRCHDCRRLGITEQGRPDAVEQVGVGYDLAFALGHRRVLHSVLHLPRKALPSSRVARVER